VRFLIAGLIASLSVVSATTHHHNKHHSVAAPSEKELESQFTSFIKTHNKKYTHDEFFPRFNTFKTNMEKIRQHNASNKDYSMASNAFADLTWEEFRASKLGYKHIDRSVMREKNAKIIVKDNIASSVD